MAIFERFGAILGRSDAILRRFGAIFERFEAVYGESLDYFVRFDFTSHPKVNISKVSKL